MMESMPPTTTLMPVDEYLRLTCKPACEYRDGVLTQKAMPTLNHSLIQTRIGQLLLNDYPDFLTGSELHVRPRENRYLVPDVAVLRKDRIHPQYPTEPIHLCVEILSPDDRFGEVVTKCEEYLAWGVPMVWIIDPVNQTAWEFSPNRPMHEVLSGGSLTAPEIAIPLAEIFSVL